MIPLQGPALRPSEVAVVCDNMLQGLGRYLRACGIDVKILSNDDDHDVAAKVSTISVGKNKTKTKRVI